MSTDTFTLARRLRAGEAVYSAWCGLPAPLVAETIAREGFSAVTIDMQHGLWGLEQVVAAIGAVAHAGAAPIVRVPLGDFATASRALDFGAEAIISPMINTPADARAFVAATKYPPLGERSWGPHRALMISKIRNQADYLREANALTVTLAMIETRTALDNLEAIAGTDGIDGLFLGPSDLSIALSNGATLDPLSKEVDAQLERISAAALKAGKIMGAFCPNAQQAVALSKRGLRFLAIGSDLTFLRAGTAAAVATLKGAAATSK